jgi:hypothetical protein
VVDRSRRAGVVWGLAWLGLALLAYLVVIPQGIREPVYAQPPPGQFPRLLALTVAVAALLLVLSEWRRLQPAVAEHISARLFLLPLLGFLFALALPRVGFLVGSAVSVLVMLFLFGERRPLVLIAITTIGSVLVTFAFVQLLNVPLPRGPW